MFDKYFLSTSLVNWQSGFHVPASKKSIGNNVEDLSHLLLISACNSRSGTLAAMSMLKKADHWGRNYMT